MLTLRRNFPYLCREIVNNFYCELYKYNSTSYSNTKVISDSIHDKEIFEIENHISSDHEHERVYFIYYSSSIGSVVALFSVNVIIGNDNYYFMRFLILENNNFSNEVRKRCDTFFEENPFGIRVFNEKGVYTLHRDKHRVKHTFRHTYRI